MIWLAIYATLVFVGFLLLLITDAQLPGDRCLFLTIVPSAMFVLAHDQVSIVGSGLYVLSAFDACRTHDAAADLVLAGSREAGTQVLVG